MGWIADLLKEIPSAAKYKSELEHIEKENNRLREELEDLKAKYKSVAPEDNKPKLQNIQIDFLLRLALSKASLETLSANLGVGLQVAEYHLEILEKANLVDRNFSMMGEPSMWYLTHEGRSYLVLNNLIS